MNRTQILISAFFLLFFGFSQTSIAQKSSELLSYRVIQNERLTIQAMRQISAAQATFQSSSPTGNFGTLAQLAEAGFIDEVLATGKKYGYNFTVTVQNSTPTTPARFTALATPQFYRRTGLRSFYLNETGVLRGADRQGAPATQNDPPVEDLCLSNEQCVITAMRTLTGAQATYQSSDINGNFASLCQLAEAGLIDEALGSGSRFGYYFAISLTRYTPNQPARYKAIAIPQNYPVTGQRSFFTDESGVLRAADRQGAPANENDLPPIENVICNSIEECENKTIFGMLTIQGAQETYKSSLGNSNYGSIIQPNEAGLLDATFLPGSRSGYLFTVTTRNAIEKQ